MGTHLVQHRLGVGAENTVGRACHAQIRDVARACGEDAGIGGGDVGVGTEYDLHPTVQMKTHGQLLRGSLAVEIQEGDVVVTLLPLQNAVGYRKGIVQLIHEGRARQIHAEDTETADLSEGVAHSGAGGGVVGGTDNDVRVIIQKAVEITASEGVIAQGDQVCPCIQECLGVCLAQAVDLGGVLSVHHHKISPKGCGGLAEGLAQILNGTATDNVANGEDFHGLCLFL